MILQPSHLHPPLQIIHVHLKLFLLRYQLVPQPREPLLITLLRQLMLLQGLRKVILLDNVFADRGLDSELLGGLLVGLFGLFELLL